MNKISFSWVAFRQVILIRSFCRFNIRGIPMENLGKAFVRHSPNEDLMKISFVYGNTSLQPREFSFLRCKTEKLDNAFQRIKVKIEAAHLKKKGKKAKCQQPSKNNQLDINILKDGMSVSCDLKNIDAWSQGMQLQVGESMYVIEENGPVVSAISLPKNIMSSFLVYPKVCLECSILEDTVFEWYRAISKAEQDPNDTAQAICTGGGGTLWLKIGEAYFYSVCDRDIGHKLKLVCIPKYGDRIGKSETVISTNPVAPGPNKCPFEDRHDYTKEPTNGSSFRCISYNILADLYADSDTAKNELFPYCPVEFLDYEYRKQLYLKEILGYNGDVICLQEVDRKVFNYDLIPVLSSAGLQGVYNEKGGQVAEGLACFFRSSKFKLLHSEAIVLSQAVTSEPYFQNILDKISENEKLKERIVNRTTTLQVVLLECTDNPKSRLLLGNTHLYFHPESDNIRLIQSAMCIQCLEHIKVNYAEKDSMSIATILCGDFNSCPQFGVFKLMTEGLVPETCVDWQSCPDEAVSGIPLSHSFSLGSACGTPAYTNFTEGFVGCLDYIFYDKHAFLVKDVVPMPTHEQVTNLRALPNKLFPSDHLAIICTLQWHCNKL